MEILTVTWSMLRFKLKRFSKKKTQQKFMKGNVEIFGAKLVYVVK